MTAEAAAPKQVVRDYVVLRERAEAPTAEPISLAIVSTIKAKSPREAISKVADKARVDGTYRAVLAKSFAPGKVTVHTETTVRLG